MRTRRTESEPNASHVAADVRRRIRAETPGGRSQACGRTHEVEAGVSKVEGGGGEVEAGIWPVKKS